MDNDIDPESVVNKTADVLMAAGEVIAELRKREVEDGGTYDGGDLLERVQVAQVLVLVASGEQALKSKKEHQKFMKDMDTNREDWKKKLEEQQKRIFQPQLQPLPRPQLVEDRPLLPEEAGKSLKDAFVVGPHPDRDAVLATPEADEKLQISVYRAGDHWTVTTWTLNNMIQKKCMNIEELARELGHAAAMVHKMKTEEKK